MSGKREKSTDRARQLRADQTFPERVLWGRLRGNRAGAKFRRQYPIGLFIVDFCCPERRLIVELDGRSHIGMWQEDRARQEWLESQGWRVLRFSNDQVLNAIGRVAERIAAECAGDTPAGGDR